ncbi:DUF4132 domain-containing protein [Acinetobacter qingfengensis]|uniref:DUF4132 domain-containing protein n=1 Tax=Acinetobacter qingfengensis TaxID=1262585 RepID=A0A1E7RCS9_9GAMM|nr:DUF4132 domain-containing protein [Acinetobacter qingfengensis]KAA8734322.1 DUF4132 domain-containing protein [Acinetobacter qingfengensis]OEY97086.1 hypothetical protein BJI46_10710 [Acinetobacter qingfengensis]
MLNQLFNKLGNLLGLQDQASLQLIQTIVMPLAKIDEQLALQAVNYIVEGNNPEILLTLSQYPDDRLCTLLDHPGTYGWYHPQYHPNHEEKKLIKASVNARTKLYIHLFEKLSAEQIIRYSKFLEAATQLRNFKQITPDAPKWFIYLVVDAFIKTDHSHQHNLPEIKKYLESWRLEKLYQLLEQNQEGTGIQAFYVLFERNEVDSYHHDRLQTMFRLQDCSSFLLQHIDTVTKILPQFSASGQLQFIEFCKKFPEFRKQVPELITALSLSNSKTVRNQATPMLSQLKTEDSQYYLKHYLQQGSSKQRGYAADQLARLGEHNLTILQHALSEEKQKSVQDNIQAAINRINSVQAVTQAEHSNTLVLPELKPLTFQDIPEQFKQVLQENYQQVLDKARQSAESEKQDNKTRQYKYDWAQRRYKELSAYTQQDIDQIFNAINGANKLKKADSYPIIYHQNKLLNYPEYSILHAIRIIFNRGRDHYIHWSSVFEKLKPEHYQHLELRQLEQILQQIGVHQPERQIARTILIHDYWDSLNHYFQDKDAIWPFFAEHLDLISEALGLLPNQEKNQYYQYSPSKAIMILGTFPTLPAQYIPRLLELALGENKNLRVEAQQLLKNVPNIQQRAIEALQSGKQEIRITAIEWLARLQHPEAIQPLNELLKKEKKEVVRAALLTAIEQLGQDISAYLSPDLLQKEAEKGLQAKVSSSFHWFNLALLPQLKWKDGTDINPQIIQWWVILAEKLKDPIPNALLQRYLELLEHKSQQILALFLLQSFIQQDTLHPSIEEAIEQAIHHAPQRLNNYQDMFKRYGQKYPEYYGKYEHVTLEQVQDEIKREHLGIYLGSAIKSKGILALTYPIAGAQAVKLLQDYMKQHYQRRAQIESMLSALSVSNDPLIIQLLLSISRRYRTASVQKLAKQFIEQIADRNHWSSDELADRTIPTAGLDDTGILTLDYGSRTLTAHVDANDKFILNNEDGKIIKALPAARQGDDESAIKESKALFNNSKKEFKQIINLQTQRLCEAMCSERLWTVADWQEYIFAHPVMQRLIQRLVWLEVDDQGQIIQTFRPSDDGSLLNLEDDEIQLNSQNKIKIAHTVLLNHEQTQAWQTHFKDYKVKFLFEQMQHALPEIKDATSTFIEDRKGWLTDTYTLRGVISKLGYQRASIEDGGSFDSYYKFFSQLEISAVIHFSGSFVPEENIPAVLYDLTFEKNQIRTWSAQGIPLDQIPKVLLAECYADYLKLAAACSGYDPEWEKKTPW